MLYFLKVYSGNTSEIVMIIIVIIALLLLLIKNLMYLSNMFAGARHWCDDNCDTCWAVFADEESVVFLKDVFW